MFNEAIRKTGANARVKADMLKKAPAKYFVLSMLAGFYVGIAVFLIYRIGAPLNAAGFPAVSVVTGLAFSVGLTIVVFAGSELFTGNVLFVTMGLLRRAVKLSEALKVLGVSFIGNLVGAFLLCYIIYCTGLLSGATSEFIISAAVAKADLNALEIISRGILCNIMVCLALWMSVRVSSEITKIVFITMCLFAFVASGYIHCVADMTHLALALLTEDGGKLGLGGSAYVLFFATVGNIIGGVFVGVAYTFAGTPE